LFTHMRLRHQAAEFGTSRQAAMFGDWEGNRIGPASHWPCVADLSGLSTYV